MSLSLSTRAEEGSDEGFGFEGVVDIQEAHDGHKQADNIERWRLYSHSRSNEQAEPSHMASLLLSLLFFASNALCGAFVSNAIDRGCGCARRIHASKPWATSAMRFPKSPHPQNAHNSPSVDSESILTTGNPCASMRGVVMGRLIASRMTR